MRTTRMAFLPETDIPLKPLLQNSEALYRCVDKFLPPAQTAEEQKKRDNFMETELTRFVEKLGDVLDCLKMDDIYSLGAPVMTDNAARLVELYELLNHNGFCGVGAFQKEKKAVSFWSGEVARLYLKHHSAQDALVNDGHVPAMAMLFSFNFTLMKHYRLPRNSAIPARMAVIFSALYASQAYGTVHLFTSNDRKDETFGGLEAGNNCWRAELPVLQQLLRSEKIEKILVHCYCDITQKWLSSIDLNNPKQTPFLRVRRGFFHQKPMSLETVTGEQLAGQETGRDYRDLSNRLNAERNRWFASPVPRQEISYAKLKKIAGNIKKRR